MNPELGVTSGSSYDFLHPSSTFNFQSTSFNSIFIFSSLVEFSGFLEPDDNGKNRQESCKETALL